MVGINHLGCRGGQVGDANDPAGLPRAHRGGEAYQSMGIAQVKWTPDGAVGAGTEPLRWLSTAFNLDYYAATLRYYYDGACNWCGPDYSPAQGWKSAGAWY